jgi:gluconolactonase
LYVVNNGMVSVLDVAGPQHQVGKPTRLADFMVDGITCRTDGIRTDVFGNLWASSNAGANVGYSGVTVWNPAGKAIGRIRLPEVCANVAFGGPKRNRLFMAAGQSLYAVYTNTQGSSPG